MLSIFYSFISSPSRRDWSLNQCWMGRARWTVRRGKNLRGRPGSGQIANSFHHAMRLELRVTYCNEIRGSILMSVDLNWDRWIWIEISGSALRLTPEEVAKYTTPVSTTMNFVFPWSHRTTGAVSGDSWAGKNQKNRFELHFFLLTVRKPEWLCTFFIDGSGNRNWDGITFSSNYTCT